MKRILLWPAVAILYSQSILAARPVEMPPSPPPQQKAVERVASVGDDKTITFGLFAPFAREVSVLSIELPAHSSE